MNNNRLITIAFSLFLIPNICTAQEKDPYDEKYEWRIRQENLYGVYIPKDVNEAFSELNRLIDAESKEKYKALSEQEVTQKLFFSLGRWISYNWGLYNGSRLSVNFRQMGITHPDNMTRFIMLAYHRSLNRKSLGIKELIEHYQMVELKEKEERQQSGTIIYEEKRQLEKPPADKNGGQ